VKKSELDSEEPRFVNWLKMLQDFCLFISVRDRTPHCCSEQCLGAPTPEAKNAPPPPTDALLPLHKIARFTSANSYAASSSSDESSSSAFSILSSVPLSFTDDLIGTAVSLALVADGKLQLPEQLRALIIPPPSAH
jgi:hypothetical protein